MEDIPIFSVIKIDIALPISMIITEKFKELRFPYTVYVLPRVAIRKILENTIGSIVQVCFNISHPAMYFRLNRFLYENLIVVDDSVLIIDDFIETGEKELFDNNGLLEYINKKIDMKEAFLSKVDSIIEEGEISHTEDDSNDFDFDFSKFFSESISEKNIESIFVDLEMVALTTEFFVPKGESRNVIKNLESEMYNFFLKTLAIENPYFYEELAFDLAIILSSAFFKIFFSIDKFREYREHIIELLSFIDENEMIFSSQLEYIVETKCLLELVSRQSIYSAINRFTRNSLSDIASDNQRLIPDYIYPLYNALINSIESFIENTHLLDEVKDTRLDEINLMDFLQVICSQVAEFMNRSYSGDFSEEFNLEISKNYENIDINALTGQIIDYLQRNDEYPDIYIAEKNESERIAENTGLYYFVRLYLEREILHSIQENHALPDWLENGYISITKMRDIANFL